MPTARLRRYRHFPTIPDALALVQLLRRAAIAFETRYERGANYGRARPMLEIVASHEGS